MHKKKRVFWRLTALLLMVLCLSAQIPAAMADDETEVTAESSAEVPEPAYEVPAEPEPQEASQAPEEPSQPEPVDETEPEAEIIPEPEPTIAPAPELPSPKPETPDASFVDPEAGETVSFPDNNDPQAPVIEEPEDPELDPGDKEDPGAESAGDPNKETKDEDEAGSYAKYQGPATYEIVGIGGAGRSYIQGVLIKMLYGGASGMVSCDFDDYGSTAGRHEGIDFTRGKGSPVYSLIDGEVTRVAAGADGGALSTVAIYDAVNNMTVVYLHTAPSEGLYAGQRITRGTFIGLESNRGCTAAHTHVEVVTGYSRYACVSVNDYVLENSDPYYYWAKILSSLEGAGAVLYGQVEPEKKPAAECDGVEYWTLQEALDAAQPGQTVTVLNDIRDSCEIGTASVTLDLAGYAITAKEGEGIIVVAAPGVTVRNGTLTGSNALCGIWLANGSEGFTADGITVSSMDVSGCVIGVSCLDGKREITFTGLTVEQCSGTVLYACSNGPTILFDSCRISDNSPASGKELICFSDADAIFRKCVIRDNCGLTNGAIYADLGANLLFSWCRVSGNTGESAGGIAFSGTSLTLRDTAINDNVSQSGASGLCMTSGKLYISGGAVYNNRLPVGPGLDIYLGSAAVAMLPAACTMQDYGADFSGFSWYRYNTRQILDGAATLPGGYTAFLNPSEQPSAVSSE